MIVLFWVLGSFATLPNALTTPSGLFPLAAAAKLKASAPKVTNALERWGSDVFGENKPPREGLLPRIVTLVWKIGSPWEPVSVLLEFDESELELELLLDPKIDLTKPTMHDQIELDCCP